MKAKSIYGGSPEQIKKALQAAMADHFKPTLAITFISIKQDRKGICEVLKKEGIAVFGATSCGEFTESHQSEGESVIMLLEIDPDYFTILTEDLKGNDLEAI